MMSLDPYETWLGIPADRRPPTHYDLLGLAPFESDPVVIDQASLRRMSRVRQHQLGPHGDLSQEVLAELARARLVLMDPDRRADYDAKLRQLDDRLPAPPSQPEGVGDPDAKPQPLGDDESMPDPLGSIDLALPRFDHGITGPRPAKRGPAAWKRCLVPTAFISLHLGLLGSGYMYLRDPWRWRQAAPVVARSSPPKNPSKPGGPAGPVRPAAPAPVMPEVDRTPSVWYSFDGKTSIAVARSEDFEMNRGDYTIFARIRTERGGTIFSKTDQGDHWVRDDKSLFVREGKLVFAIGKVDSAEAARPIGDGEWHDVAMTFSHERERGLVRLYVDGKLDRRKLLAPTPRTDARGHIVRVGFTPHGYPCGQEYFLGDVAQVRFYGRALTPQEIRALPTKQPGDDPTVACWILGHVLGTPIVDRAGHGHAGTVESEAMPDPPPSADDNAGEADDRTIHSGEAGVKQPEEERKPGSPADVLRSHGLEARRVALSVEARRGGCCYSGGRGKSSCHDIVQLPDGADRAAVQPRRIPAVQERSASSDQRVEG